MKYYFVDEAGDLTLFNKRGKVMLGREGVSNFFIVGTALIPNPERVEKELSRLRQELINNPYFSGVPSFDVKRNKTAVSFHAKDDLPEVRYEVFKLIKTLNIKIYVAFRRKEILIKQAREVFEQKKEKINPEEIYESLVSKLFKHVLNGQEHCHITFARRGTVNRRNALIEALEHTGHITGMKSFDIDVTYSSKYAGLQVADYCIWALQRLLEREEDRFLSFLQNAFEIIIDVDNLDEGASGAIYTPKKLISLKDIKPFTS